MTAGVQPGGLTLRITEREMLADGVAGLTLAHPDDQALPAWSAGAHIDVRLDGDGVRQYSLCGDVHDRGRYRIAVLRKDRAEGGQGGSARMHELQVGMALSVDGPRNHFALHPSPRYLFIAGGIGITPILPMLAEATARGADWRCVYGGRSRASMAFTDALATHGDAIALRPQDEHGLIELDGLLREPRPDTLVYCCGPEPLLQAVAAACARHGWAEDALHVERFAAATPAAPGGDTPFEVVLARSRTRVTVAADQTLLEALEHVGIPVVSSCGAGVCGTCETPVLEGEPDHRDAILSNAERACGKTMMICVSRARSASLVLDL
jgi:ferredoxin-NADP reductase